MTIAQHITPDGYQIRVFSSMYLDYGLEISRFGKDLYYSPSALSNESYGSKPAERFDGEWEDAEKASLDGDDSAFIEWTEKDWEVSLEAESDALIEAFCPEGH